MDKRYAEVNGVEIFRAGMQKGDLYTEEDLDEIVRASKELDYTPPAKAGHHNNQPGMPALGWVKNVRRVGDRLYADFKDVPQVVYDAIRQKMFNTVSSEIWWDLKRGGKQYKRALKAVSLLGADIPAVPGLKTLYETIGGDALAYQDVPAHAAYEQDLKFSWSSPLAVLSAAQLEHRVAIAEAHCRLLRLERRI